MKRIPLKVGITGGIGAGKSTVIKVFSLLGIPAYNADSRAKWLMNHNSEVIHNLTKIFGQEAYSPENVLNSQFIAKKAFNDPEKLRKLNNVVHPKVADDYQAWLTCRQDAPYTLKEAALLFESGSFKQLDAVILVTAPDSIRLDRISIRDPFRSRDDIKKIMRQQWPESKKINLANHIIINDESELVVPQVLKLHAIFLHNHSLREVSIKT